MGAEAREARGATAVGFVSCPFVCARLLIGGDVAELRAKKRALAESFAVASDVLNLCVIKGSG